MKRIYRRVNQWIELGCRNDSTLVFRNTGNVVSVHSQEIGCENACIGCNQELPVIQTIRFKPVEKQTDQIQLITYPMCTKIQAMEIQSRLCIREATRRIIQYTCLTHFKIFYLTKTEIYFLIEFLTKLNRLFCILIRIKQLIFGIFTNQC